MFEERHLHLPILRRRRLAAYYIAAADFECARNATCGIFRRWRLMARICRQSIKRVCHVGCVQHALKDTDLQFCIRHHSAVLDSFVKRERTRSEENVLCEWWK